MNKTGKSNLKTFLGAVLATAAMVVTAIPASAQGMRSGDSGQRGERVQQDRRGGGDDRRSQGRWERRNDDRRGGIRTQPRGEDRRGNQQRWERDRGDRNWDRARGDDRNWDRTRNRTPNQERGDRVRDRNWDRNNDSRRWEYDDRRGWNNGYGDQWYRNWRQDRRYDWNRYRNDYRERYRLGTYYSPYRNYGYSRFRIGLTIRPAYYSSRYWIRDPYYYRLPPAPAYMRWVRYYDDVLLVDIRRGRVVDVIHNFFW